MVGRGSLQRYGKSFWTIPLHFCEVNKNGFPTDGPTDRLTNGLTDGQTDRPSYRDAWTHLKRMCSGEKCLISYAQIYYEIKEEKSCWFLLRRFCQILVKMVDNYVVKN